MPLRPCPAPFDLRSLLLGSLVVLGLRTAAQCTGSLDLGPDIQACPGATVVLHAPGGFATYTWDDGSTGQDHAVAGPGTYTCTVTQFDYTQDLVVNGDFSFGNTGFTSDYNVGTGGPWGPVSDPQTYAITSDPHLVHSNFASYGDHTGGGGNMMVVNGAQTAGVNVWCQTITVTPNTDYAFSAWLSSTVSDNPAVLEFSINGIAVGDPLNASFSPGLWEEFHAIWNSGASTSATICITNQNTLDGGNDFALDDIGFSPMCTYTDQIAVIALPSPAPDLGADQVLCSSTPLTLDPHWPTATGSFHWNTGATTATLAPTTSGTYWVDVTENGCTTRDSIDVLFKPLPTVSFGPDQDRCAGDDLLLDATNTGATYAWQDGSSGSTFLVSGTGTYRVRVDLNGCTTADTIAVTYHPLPVVSLGPDTSICADSPYTLDVDRAGGSYLWDDGSTAPQRTVDTQHWYWVDVTESVCTTRDSLYVDVRTLPVVDLRPDFLLCVGTTEVLDAYGPGYTYRWQDGSTDSVYVVDRPGPIHVTVANDCAAASDSLFVTQGFCDCPVFVPNSFTPDGDGQNDGFLPRFDCPVDTYALRIYDRWGKVIWSTEDPYRAWDGAGIPEGVYTWDLALHTVTVLDNYRRQYRGQVVVVR